MLERVLRRWLLLQRGVQRRVHGLRRLAHWLAERYLRQHPLGPRPQWGLHGPGRRELPEDRRLQRERSVQALSSGHSVCARELRLGYHVDGGGHLQRQRNLRRQRHTELQPLHLQRQQLQDELREQHRLRPRLLLQRHHVPAGSRSERNAVLYSSTVRQRILCRRVLLQHVLLGRVQDLRWRPQRQRRERDMRQRQRMLGSVQRMRWDLRLRQVLEPLPVSLG